MKNVISVDSKCQLCDKPKKSKGYCPTHYARFRKYGDATKTATVRHGMTKTRIYSK